MVPDVYVPTHYISYYIIHPENPTVIMDDIYWTTPGTCQLGPRRGEPVTAPGATHTWYRSLTFDVPKHFCNK